ncbi:hypothetical protein BH10ACI1_BH10ACI1_30590 [soil metagenome]
MIHAHFAAIENAILATSKIQENSGHTLHKGTPREIFIKNFLSTHLGETVSLGTGEIVDCNSKPKESRNQFDIVIHKKEFPKLDFQGGISAFVAESVIATIEVKSSLTYEDFYNAFIAATKCKKMERHFYEGLKLWYQPPKIMNIIVAYNGPAKMKTVYEWIKKIEKELGITYPEMPSDIQDRINIPSFGIDGVFILGKGYLHFDNWLINQFHPKLRNENNWAKWLFGNTLNSNLMILFLNLSQIINTYSQRSLNMIPYLNEIDVEAFSWGE